MRIPWDLAHWARGMDRRHFLGAAAALPFVLSTRSLIHATQNQTEGLIERMREPQNLEFPFHTLDGFIVSNERFYVRNHFAQPRLDAQSWRLGVSGAVTRELE